MRAAGGGQPDLAEMGDCKIDQSWKALSQWSELVILFYWVGGGLGEGDMVIWALNDLNDKSEASAHLYTTSDREILLDTKLQSSAEVKGMKIKVVH